MERTPLRETNESAQQEEEKKDYSLPIVKKETFVLIGTKFFTEDCENLAVKKHDSISRMPYFKKMIVENIA